MPNVVTEWLLHVSDHKFRAGLVFYNQILLSTCLV